MNKVYSHYRQLFFKHSCVLMDKAYSIAKDLSLSLNKAYVQTSPYE